MFVLFASDLACSYRQSLYLFCTWHLAELGSDKRHPECSSLQWRTPYGPALPSDSKRHGRGTRFYRGGQLFTVRETVKYSPGTRFYGGQKFI